MNDQTPAYIEGTWVWTNLFNKEWYPGKIVLKDDVPEQIAKKINNKGEPLAIVHFDKENKYEFVYEPTRLCLYNSTNKMEYINKGYDSYIKQTKGQLELGKFNYEQFINVVTRIETELGGDKNIFKQFEKKNEQLSIDNKNVLPSTKPKNTGKYLRESEINICKNETPSLTETKVTATIATAIKDKITKTIDEYEITETVEKIENEEMTQTVFMKTMSEENNLNSKSVKRNPSIVINHNVVFNDNISEVQEIKRYKQLDHTDNNLDGIKNTNSEINEYVMKSIKVVSVQYLDKNFDISSLSNLTDTDICEHVNVDLLDKNSGNDNLEINADIQQPDDNTGNLEINADIQQSDDNSLNLKINADVHELDDNTYNLDINADIQESDDNTFNLKINSDIQQSDDNTCNNLSKVENEKSSPPVNVNAIDCSEKIPSSKPITPLSPQPTSSEPKTTPDIDEEKCRPGYERRYIWVQADPSIKIHTDEELLKKPLIKKILHLIETGQADKVRCRFNNAKVVIND